MRKKICTLYCVRFETPKETETNCMIICKLKQNPIFVKSTKTGTPEVTIEQLGFKGSFEYDSMPNALLQNKCIQHTPINYNHLLKKYARVLTVYLAVVFDDIHVY